MKKSILALSVLAAAAMSAPAFAEEWKSRGGVASIENDSGASLTLACGADPLEIIVKLSADTPSADMSGGSLQFSVGEKSISRSGGLSVESADGLVSVSREFTRGRSGDGREIIQAVKRGTGSVTVSVLDADGSAIAGMSDEFPLRGARRSIRGCGQN